MSVPRSAGLVVNPTSGRRRGRQVADVAAATLRDAGVAVTIVEGRDAADASTRARQCLDDGAEALVVVGGDGMLHAAAQILAGTSTPLGVVPAGTGNDVARLLGIDSTDPVSAAGVVAAGRTRDLDLADVDGTYVLTVVACGFDAEVNRRADGLRWVRGQTRYNLATVAELGRFAPHDYTLVLDGVRHDLSAMLVAVGNGPSYGGGLRMCEGARVDDGMLDVVVIRPMGRLGMLRVFPRLFDGTHVTLPQYEHHRVREVTVDTPGVLAYGDGEPLADLPLTVRAAPGALRVFAP